MPKVKPLKMKKNHNLISITLKQNLITSKINKHWVIYQTNQIS